jgi:hypothetical protein
MGNIRCRTRRISTYREGRFEIVDIKPIRPIETKRPKPISDSTLPSSLQAVLDLRNAALWTPLTAFRSTLAVKTKTDSCEHNPAGLTAAKGRQRRGRADHGTGGHENNVCVCIKVHVAVH